MGGSGVETGVETARPMAPTRTLTVLYDERCAVCRRCRDWLLTQPCRLRVELLPSGSTQAHRRYGDVPWLGRELIAVDDVGRVWIGPAAFLTCLWATVRYRPWAYLLSGPTFAALAERFFLHVSKRRDRWSTWLEPAERAERGSSECSWCDGTQLLSPDP